MLILYCKAFRGGRSQEEIDTLAQSNAGTQALHSMPLPSRSNMLLWIFPEDPAIPHLPEVARSSASYRASPLLSLPKGLEGEHIRSVKWRL